MIDVKKLIAVALALGDGGQEEKFAAIRAAIDQKLVTKKQLDPGSRGSNICKLLRGKSTPATVNKAFSVLVNFTKRSLHPVPSIQIFPTEKEAREFSKQSRPAILGRVEAIEARLSILEGQGQIIETKIETADQIHGWGLYQRKTGGPGKYWYAGKSINGHQRWIYVGKTVSQAKEKIEAWLIKNKIPF